MSDLLGHSLTYRLPGFNWQAFYRVIVRGIGPESIESVQVDLDAFLHIQNNTAATFPDARVAIVGPDESLLPATKPFGLLALDYDNPLTDLWRNPPAPNRWSPRPIRWMSPPVYRRMAGQKSVLRASRANQRKSRMFAILRSSMPPRRRATAPTRAANPQHAGHGPRLCPAARPCGLVSGCGARRTISVGPRAAYALPRHTGIGLGHSRNRA